jgi:hypothetical protein
LSKICEACDLKYIEISTLETFIKKSRQAQTLAEKKLGELCSIETRIKIAEKNVCLVREEILLSENDPVELNLKQAQEDTMLEIAMVGSKIKVYNMSEENLDEIFVKTNQDYQTMTQTVQSSRQKFEETKNTKRELDDEIRELENQILVQRNVLKAKNIQDPESQVKTGKVFTGVDIGSKSDSNKEFNYFDHILGNRDSSDIIIFGDDPWKCGEQGLRNKAGSSAKRTDTAFDRRLANVGSMGSGKISQGSNVGPNKKNQKNQKLGEKKGSWFCC